MKTLLALVSAVVLFQTASVAQADIGFSINVGGPEIVVSQPPDFLYPPGLGFGVAVGVPYDMFYFDDTYFVFRGGGWYRTSYYGGDWVRVRTRELPPELRRYSLRRIHAFRDREYRAYGRDRDHYRGQHFRPEGGRREEHRDMHEQRHDEHRDMHEQRHDEHRDMHDQRPDEHRDMREQRPDEHKDMREQRPDEHRDMREQRPDERGGERREQDH